MSSNFFYVFLKGDILIQHFGGPTGERMKKSYGIFCSRHKEGIDYYKQLYKADRKFQAFIKVIILYYPLFIIIYNFLVVCNNIVISNIV